MRAGCGPDRRRPDRPGGGGARRAPPTSRSSTASGRGSWPPTAPSTGPRWPRSPSPTPTRWPALNAITHPAISRRHGRSAAPPRSGTDHVVVLDIPLLKPAHRDLLALDVVVVVDCPVEMALERLVEQRGFSREDAEARIGGPGRPRGAPARAPTSSSTTPSDRAHLVAEVDRVWASLEARPRPRPRTADALTSPGPAGVSHPPGTIGRCPVSRWCPRCAPRATSRGPSPVWPRGSTAATATRPCWASPGAGRRPPSPGPSKRPSGPP